MSSRRARVITASNRAAIGVYADRSGPVLAQGLAAMGFEVDGPIVVADGEPVGQELRRAVADGVHLIVTTGGTGISPTDRTPEVTRDLLDQEVPGIAEALRAAGIAKGVAASMLSRGVAGVSQGCLIINLPGSRGGVRDALEVLGPILGHALDQLVGGDHELDQRCSTERPAGDAGKAAT